MQQKIVKLTSAIRNLWYNMNEGMHSKHEINLREDTDLTDVLAKLGVSLVKRQTGTLSLFRCFAGLRYCCPIVLKLEY